jgi:hypothetical protein
VIDAKDAVLVTTDTTELSSRLDRAIGTEKPIPKEIDYRKIAVSMVGETGPIFDGTIQYAVGLLSLTGPIGRHAGLAIYQFIRIRQSGGRERPDRRSLTMRRSPLVNQDVLPLFSFLG